MRVLILSCNTGGGHNACAEAIQTAFSEHGHHCSIADALGFVSDKLSRFISWGHTTIYRHVPGLHRKGYGFAEKHPAMLKDNAAVYRLLTGGTEQLYAYIREGGYDMVICTHVFSGLLLRQTLRENPIKLKTAFVATDYTCSPGVAKSELDFYFIPADALQKEFVEQGVPQNRIIVSGIPVCREFYTAANKEQAKIKLGIDPSHMHLLMMCGSMGCGPMEKLAELLRTQMHNDMELSIICGTNEKLKNELTEKYAAYPNIRIYGFVRDMGAMMDSADLYLTKPGGLSSTEAAAKKLPMVLIDAVAGCEEYNRNYFVSLGGAVTADTPKKLAQLCMEIVKDPAKRSAMANALDCAISGNAAQQIYAAMKEEML